jgi:hypothetical protein
VYNQKTFFAAAVVTFILCGICTQLKVGAASPAVTVGNAMLKIHPTDVPPSATTAEIHAAQNEFEAFQIVVAGPVTGVYMSPPVLVGPNGSTIPGSEVRLYREAYQNITTPSNTEGGTGLWPDALIPDVDETANEKRNAFPFEVPSGENRVVWVEVHVPQGQQIGTYQGGVTVSGTGLGTVTVPVTLLVWDFALPSTSSLASTFGVGWSAACVAFYGSYTACGGDTGVEQTHLMFSRFMLDHRITADVVYYGPSGCTGLNCDWTHFDATYGSLFDGTDPNLRLQGAAQTTIQYIWNKTSSSYYAGWAQHFQQKGWFGRTYDYTCDEPPNGCAWSDITSRASMVHQGDPNFPTLVTTSVNSASGNGVAGSINVLTPVINWMNDKSGTYAGNQRPNYNPFLQTTNNRLWWYQSCMSDGCNTVGGTYFSGWPSFMVDNTAAQNRSQGMLSWLYRVSSVLYYDIDYALSTAWNSVYAFGGNGDGTLLYPGTPSVIGGTTNVPVASIRLKMIREAFEDYEYMKLVSDLGDPCFALHTGLALFPNIYSSAVTPDAFNTARESLANRILALKGSSQATGTAGSTSSCTLMDGTVVNGTSPLSITTTSLPGATQNAAYSATVSATGGATPYSWSIASGPLPAGVTLGTSSGVISGTPTGSGTSTFTIQVTDANSQQATASLTLAVSPQPQPPAITTTSLPGATQNRVYKATLSATGGTTPYSWSIVSGSLPPGLTLRSTTGVVSGVPTKTGMSTFTVQVMDANSLKATATLTLMVRRR